MKTREISQKKELLILMLFSLIFCLFALLVPLIINILIINLIHARSHLEQLTITSITGLIVGINGLNLAMTCGAWKLQSQGKIKTGIAILGFTLLGEIFCLIITPWVLRSLF